jgi:hypothetical protein
VHVSEVERPAESQVRQYAATAAEALAPALRAAH